MTRPHRGAIPVLCYIVYGSILILAGCGKEPAAPEYPDRGPAQNTRDQAPPEPDAAPKEKSARPPTESGSEGLESALRKALEQSQSGTRGAPESEPDAPDEADGPAGQGGSISGKGSERPADPTDPVDPTRPASPDEALTRAGTLARQADRALTQDDVVRAYTRLNAALDALEAFPDDARCRERAAGLLDRIKDLEARLESRPGASASGAEPLIDP